MIITLSVARIKKGEKPIFRMRTAVERRIGASVRGMGIFFLFQRQQDKNTGRQLREDGSEGGTCNIHMQQKDKYGIQYDVDNRTDQGCCHPKPRISLRGDEIVHAHGQQGEERAECINRHVGIGVGKCCFGLRRTIEEAELSAIETKW